jgi:hypothetical protein
VTVTEGKDQFNTEVDRLSLIKKVFDNEDGHKMIAVLLGTCGVLAPSSDLTSQKLAYMEGRRSVALELVQAVHQDPTEYLKLLKEAYAEQDQM